MNRLGIMAVTLMMAVAPSMVNAQESRAQRVQKLYASAEYEEVLNLLVEATAPSEQLYRALCLLALGRTTEADGALQALVSSAPDFTVSATELPPRIVALLTETRRQQLPVIVRRLFTEARDHYHAKTYTAALPRFETIVAITSQPDVRDVETLADLRTLAEGFIDLARAPRSEVPEVTASAPPPSDAKSDRPQTTIPVVVKQELPPWPRELQPIAAVSSGTVRLQISSTGTVTGATIVKGIDPRYDMRLLAAARSWQYRPATLNGVPVESQSVVEVRVVPPR